MPFKYLPNANVPCLAWLASVNSSTGECRIEHGRLIEARERFFVEGVWPGPFQDGNFDRCETFFGSGAVKRSDDEIAFIPSSATVDFLYYSVTAERVFCSNSLPYLLAACDDKLDEFNPEYSRINNSIVKGIDNYEQKIPTRRGNVGRLMYYNLVVKGGMVRQEAKPLPPVFDSFEQYRSYFSDILTRIIQNARDPDRSVQLKVLSTQSTGYDSTAINAIARDSGVDLALSISEPKERLNYFRRKQELNRPSDSGEEICRQLGIKMASIDRRYFLKDPNFEKLYWAGVHCCEDMNLHEVCKYVEKGAVLLTGQLGEMWYNASSTPSDRLRMVNDQLEKWDLSGASLSEARLHIGYVHAPAPYIGARSRKSIFALTHSESMRNWSIGGTYDRPIPRRLAEEAGVPRHLFGQVKLATVVELLPPYLPHGSLLRKEFSSYVKRKRGPLALMQMRLLPKINSAVVKLQWRIGRLPPWLLLGKLVNRIPMLGRRFNSVLYAYCVNKTARAYVDTRKSEKAG